jgi:nitroreductase
VNDQTHTLLNLIRTRRSYGLPALKPDPIPQAHVALMLEAANWSPSHGLTEPWRFTVFAGEQRAALGERFAEAYRLITPPEKYDPKAEEAQRWRPFGASVWISIGMFRSGNNKMPEWEDLASVAIAVQHIHLVAHSLGYGGKWVSGEIVRHDCVRDFVGLQPPSKLLGFFFVGWPADGAAPAAQRSPIEAKVSWRW